MLSAVALGVLILGSISVVGGSQPLCSCVRCSPRDGGLFHGSEVAFLNHTEKKIR